MAALFFQIFFNAEWYTDTYTAVIYFREAKAILKTQS